MKKGILILLILSATCGAMSAKDILLYSYQAQRIEFKNQALVSLLDSIAEHVENMSCHCNCDSIVYNVSFSKTTNWPSDKRVVIGVYIDDMQNYLCRDWKYVSYLNRKGKMYRIYVTICCEEDADWVSAASSEFFTVTESITQKKYKRQYTKKELQMLYEQCQVEDDGGTDIYFVYDNGIFSYWRGRFCDGSIISP